MMVSVAGPARKYVTKAMKAAASEGKAEPVESVTRGTNGDGAGERAPVY
jgi:hypothetical protein